MHDDSRGGQIQMKPLTVLVLGPTYPEPANIIKQNHVHNQLLAYQRHGLMPTVIDLMPSRPGIRREIFEGIPVIRFGILPRGLLRSFLFRFWFQKKLRTLLREILPDFDIVHVHFCLVQLLPLLDLLRTKPLFFTCHGDDVYPSKIPSLERKRRALLRGARTITAVSQYTAGLVSHYVSSSVRVAFVPNGIRSDIFSQAGQIAPEEARSKLGLPAARRIVLMACSLIERKGVMQVLEAFRTVHRELPETSLVVIGTGELQQPMKEYIAANGLNDAVQMTDYVDDDTRMALYYRASDLYVMLSKTVENRMGAGVEGFGISYIDANAAGIPVIGGRSGGVESAVLDGKTGFLVDPDCPEVISSLADKMRLLLGDDTLRKDMGKAGQERAFEHMTWDHNVEKIRSLYAAALLNLGD